MAMTETRFPIRYSPRFTWLFVPLFLGPRHAEVRLGADALHVRMGWAFDATIPRASIRWARRAHDEVWAIGVHTSFRGRWIVNGSSTGMVDLGIDPPAPAITGPFPARLRMLSLGLRDPEGFLAALGLPEA